MNPDRQPSSVAGNDAAPGGGRLDEGRKYWKAAIAHLAPEKREAAWEFYLDRLESSAAADTLGGVMLLLEAHLAFFDDLPARLAEAARQIETASQPRGTATSPPTPRATPAPTPRRGWRTFLISSASAAIGGATVYLALTAARHSAPTAPATQPGRGDRFLFARPNAIQVEPWSDPATHHPCGATVSFGRVAWAERTASGGAKVYVLSPVEEVRRDLEELRQSSQ